MLDFKLFDPSAALRDCVRSYLVIDTEKLEIPDRYTLFPTNTSALSFLAKPGILFLDDHHDKFSEASAITITGQLTSKWTQEFRQGGQIVTAIFSAVGMYQLFGIYMKDLTDKVANAFDLCSKTELLNCMETILDVSPVFKKLQTLETFLLNRLRKNGQTLYGLDHIVGLINKQKGNISIGSLPALINMSSKTFERNFDQKIGICPKMFCRISRFSHAIKMLYQHMDIFQVIDRCGYADQAHLIKEFKSFTGNTPKQFGKTEETLVRFLIDHFVEE